MKYRIPEVLLGVFLTVAVFELGYLFALLAPPEQGATSQRDKAAEGEPHQVSNAESRIADSTFWLMVFNAILGVSTVGLWVETGRTRRQQRSDTRVLQRAYLAVDGYGFDPFDHPKHSVAEIGVVNVGHLPARHVTWFIDCELSHDGKRSDFPIREDRFYGQDGQMVIAPGATMRRSQNEAFDSTAVSYFRAGGWHLYVWGEIRYLDGFGEKRFTRFCHRYGARGLFSKSDEDRNIVWFITGASMRYHQFGNDAD